MTSVLGLEQIKFPSSSSSCPSFPFRSHPDLQPAINPPLYVPEILHHPLINRYAKDKNSHYFYPCIESDRVLWSFYRPEYTCTHTIN
ncbi:hypothetical protein DsansV1_C14g0131581 [Dioscorea sansibarensis]